MFIPPDWVLGCLQLRSWAKASAWVRASALTRASAFAWNANVSARANASVEIRPSATVISNPRIGTIFLRSSAGRRL